MQRLVDANAVKENHKRWIGYLDDDMIGRMNFAIDHHVSTVLTIPDNPTNGTMVMKMFNSYYAETDNEVVKIEIGGKIVEFDLDWWNAAYKPQESEGKECQI